MRPTPVQLEQNDAFRRAFTLMNETHQSLFITGKAGTGKSTLLDYFCLHTAKKPVVLAPTGVAALNVRGQTIHRFFNFYIDVTVDKIQKKEIRPRNKKLYEKLETIIIDEISMVRADLLDCIDTFLRLYGPKTGEPFGGVQMIFVGDLYQLPPVVSRDESSIFESHYKSPYFFDAHVMREITVDTIELDKVYRQKERDFIDLLGRVRNNTPTEDDINALNARFDPDPKKNDSDFTIYLTTTNAAADAVNDDHLKALPGKTYISTAELSGDVSKEYYPTATELSFKAGAQIMLLNNDPKRRWVNGSIGTIESIRIDEEDNEYLRVRLEGENDIVAVYPFMWEVYKFKLQDNAITSEAVGTFTQYPFRLAWAITIHKSQGKTFNNVVFDIGRGAFAAGQVYVALSRCTTLEGLRLKTRLARHNIRTDPRIGAFMSAPAYAKSEENMPLEAKISLIQDAIKKGQALRLSYLKPDQTESTRIVDPAHVGDESFHGQHYIGLRGFCRERQDNRVFRVDRILKIEMDVAAPPKKKKAT